MNATKKLTESALLSSLFVVSSIIAVGIGFGYALYLDFVVPIFFCIICLKCDLKYTILSAITSLTIVSLVLGNIGTAIWISQSMILGITCGFLMSKDTTILDDIVLGSIVGVILMVLIDIYASALIGYSFMKEFQVYANMFPYKEYIDTVYYALIAVFPLGTVFSIYFLALILGKRINVVKGNSNKKFYLIRNFKNCGRFICCSKKVFYGCVLYLLLVELIHLLGINFNQIYIKTVVISIQYLIFYFVIRDSFTLVQNFILSKYQKVSYARILSLVTLILLVVLFKITVLIFIILNIILDKKLNIRIRQTNIINTYANNLIRK